MGCSQAKFRGTEIEANENLFYPARYIGPQLYILLSSGGEWHNAIFGIRTQLGGILRFARSGVTDFQTAMRLVKERGRFMHEAIPQGGGAMAALLCIERETVEKICEEVDGIVEVANYNAPGQIVISGEGGAVNAAVSLAYDEGVRKVIKLPVGAPFHCSLLSKASDLMSRVLEEVEFGELAFPIYANVTGREIRNSVEAKDSSRETDQFLRHVGRFGSLCRKRKT